MSGLKNIPNDTVKNNTLYQKSAFDYEIQWNFYKHNRWNTGTTSRHRYECMGATTLISEHIEGRKNIRILDAGCSDGRATKDCKMWLENMGYNVSFTGVDSMSGISVSVCGMVDVVS